MEVLKWTKIENIDSKIDILTLAFDNVSKIHFEQTSTNILNRKFGMIESHDN